METLSGSIRDRMPSDLLQYILKQDTFTNVPICEQEPANVACETISLGAFEMKAYFPISPGDKTVVFMHLPGGIRKRGIDRDESWCSNMAKDSESIYISVDYPSCLDVTYRQILTDCQYAYEVVRGMCIGSWKDIWDTDPSRIVLSGASFGATLAMIVAAIVARNAEPVYGLITLVPVINTDPDLTNDPWGKNERTVGLTPEQLLEDLKLVFQGELPDDRDHWHCNPLKMPDEVVRMLPAMIMVSAKLDILYQSQVAFKNRLQARGVKVDWSDFDGLHQMKDMDQVTDAGRAVRQHVTQKSREFGGLAMDSLEIVGN